MLLMLKQDEEVGEGFYHEFLHHISGLVFVSLREGLKKTGKKRSG